MFQDLSFPKILRGVLILVLFALLAVFLIHSPTGNHGLDGYLKTGQEIWQTKNIIAGAAHSQLAEVLFYGIYSLLKIKGLIVFSALMILASFGTIFSIAYKKKYFLFSVLAGFLSVFLMIHGMEIQPEIFGFLFFALFLLIFEKNKEKIKWHFWLLILWQILWVAFCESFYFGFFLIVLFFINRLWARRKAVYSAARNKKIDKYIFQVFSAGLFSALVCILSPGKWQRIDWQPFLGLIFMLVFVNGFILIREKYELLFYKWDQSKTRRAVRLLTILVLFVILAGSIRNVVLNKFYLKYGVGGEFGLKLPEFTFGAFSFLAKKGISYPPDFIQSKESQLILSKFYAVKGDWRNAIWAAEKAIEIDKKYMAAYDFLGKIYYQQGNFSEARCIWQEALKEDSSNKDIKYYLDNMGLIPFKK